MILDREFLSFCQQTFDESRHYLKNCGKPQDDIDRWFINFHKETCSIFNGILNPDLKKIKQKKALEKAKNIMKQY